MLWGKNKRGKVNCGLPIKLHWEKNLYGGRGGLEIQHVLNADVNGN